jgi:hypothetical protein
MKKALLVSMAVWMLVLTLPAHALISGDYAYTDNGDGTCTIPENLASLTVTRIGNGAFENDTRLTGVIIPDSITIIGYYAFRNCTSLTRVIVGGGSLIEFIFSGCSSLSDVIVSDSVTVILSRAFNGTPNLQTITVDEDNPNYCSIDGVLFNKTQTSLIKYPEGKTGDRLIVWCRCDCVLHPGNHRVGFNLWGAADGGLGVVGGGCGCRWGGGILGFCHACRGVGGEQRRGGV